MVEVVAIQGSRFPEPGVVRVLRVLRGPLRPGQRLTLRTAPTSACGAGELQRGSRGLILIDRLRGPLFFQGYLTVDFLQRLDRLGLRPIRAPAGR
jgi:hypothetical protein